MSAAEGIEPIAILRRAQRFAAKLSISGLFYYCSGVTSTHSSLPQRVPRHTE